MSSAPVGDPGRQAVASLKGYAYQLYASALAWLDLRDGEELYLEVAEDYAVVAQDAMKATQVKDTAAALTIRSRAAIGALDSFVDLVQRNPGRDVRLHFLTTSPIGAERATEDRVDGGSTLEYWRRAAAGAPMAPLRKVLEGLTLSERARSFIVSLDNEGLRQELVRKVHWECGQPSFEYLRQELDDRLTKLGEAEFGLPPSEGVHLTATVISQLLRVASSSGQRCLTATALRTLLDDASRVGVRVAAIDDILNKLTGAFGEASSIAKVPATTLEPVIDLPWPALLADRTALVSSASEMVRTHGVAVLSGGTGMGKTLLARLAAKDVGGEWFILDLRDAQPKEAAERLRRAALDIPRLRPRGVIIDDANDLDDASVQVALARFAATLRRADASSLVTLYRPPSTRARDQVGIPTASLVQLPDLTVDEVATLVTRAGGELKWARMVHAIGAFGHPQLTQAAIAGLRARNWPEQELRAAIYTFATEDVTAERSAARQRLISELEEPTRRLLYRASLVIGRFDRRIASAIGEISPAISMPGEHLDQLIGPWVDQSGKTHLRVSPLVANAGHEVLDASEQKAVHKVTAETLLRDKAIDVEIANAAFLHGLQGEAEVPLLKLAGAVTHASEELATQLADRLIGIRLHRTDRPIYPPNKTLSRLLRFAQLMLLAGARDEKALNECWDALTAELQGESNEVLGEQFEGMVLAKLLCRKSIADIFPRWLDLVIRLDELTRRSPALREITENFEQSRDGAVHFSVTGFMFTLHAMGMPGVAALEALFRRLDGLPRDLRDRLLGDLPKSPGDFGLVVSQGWLADHKKDAVNGTEAAQAYARMAGLAHEWGYSLLAMRCELARAVMLDEYAKDPAGAIVVLADAERRFGSLAPIVRSRAKIAYRSGDYATALGALASIAEDESFEHGVERAFIAREAGVSAGFIGDWKAARTWFMRAREQALKSPNQAMKVMAVGLCADTAVAAWNAGERSAAVKGLAQAMTELEKVEAAESLTAIACHKIVRHAILWMFTKARGQGSVEIVPGACSNPEPHAGLAEGVLAHDDMAWYLLAELEATADVDVGGQTSLPARLKVGPIPVMEIDLRRARLRTAMRCSDRARFVTSFAPWVDGMVYAVAHRDQIRGTDLQRPVRDTIPQANGTQLADTNLVFTAEHAVLIFGFIAAVTGKGAAALTLATAMRSAVGDTYPGVAAAVRLERGSSDDDPISLINLMALRPLSIDELFAAGVRFLHAFADSPWRDTTENIFDQWFCDEWRNAITNQRFALRNLREAVPAIEAALQTDDGLGRVARVLIAAEISVSRKLSPELRTYVQGMAGGT